MKSALLVELLATLAGLAARPLPVMERQLICHERQREKKGAKTAIAILIERFATKYGPQPLSLQ